MRPNTSIVVTHLIHASSSIVELRLLRRQPAFCDQHLHGRITSANVRPQKGCGIAFFDMAANLAAKERA
jgi:hypothetical protein